MRASRVIALIVLVAAGGAVVAQEKVENPLYTNWAKFKPGTSVTMKTVTASAMFNSESSVTTTLLEVTADKVVVEMSVKSKIGGMEVAAAPMKHEYAKTVELPKGAKKDAIGQKPEGTTKEGTETLKVGGAELKAKWYEIESKANGMDVSTKMWSSDDVPGTVIKMTTKIGGTAATAMTMELTEFKKP